MITKGPGGPGTSPLPNSGQQGVPYTMQQKMHPAAAAGMQQQRARMGGRMPGAKR
jgi:hypothetical protein